MVDDCRIFQVELDQFIVAFPAFVPKSVVVVGVAVKGDMEPILIRRVPFFLLHIAEGPETAANVIEYPVEHDPDAVVVQRAAHGGKIVIGTQAAINLAKIAGVVAMAVRLKDGRKINGVDAEFYQMVGPIGDLLDAVDRLAVVDARCTAKTDGTDLIETLDRVLHGDHSFNAIHRIGG